MKQLLAIILSLFSAAHADIILVSDYGTNDGVTQADVESAIAAAWPGDTVQLSGGTAPWSTELVINKGIHLKGDGIGSTVITNTQGTGGSVNSGQWQVIDITLSANRTTISGFTFDGNRTGNGIYMGGTTGQEGIIYNCRFFEVRGRAIENRGMHSGLIYNCTFDDCFKTTDVYGAAANQNAPFAAALTLGTIECVVREDNTINYTDGGWYPVSAGGTCSHDYGGRGVFRYNTWNNLGALEIYPIVDAHGNAATVSGTSTDEPPGGTGSDRGTRQLEVYANTHNHYGTASNVRPFDLRGGTCVIFDNQYNDLGSGSFSNSIRVREEDAPYENNLVSAYPGMDMHRLWYWDNMLDAGEITGLSNQNAQDANYIVIGTNAYNREPESGDIIDISSYTPLVYPHPWRAAASFTQRKTPQRKVRGVLAR